MKIQTANNEEYDVTLGDMEEVSFSISTESPIIYEILRSRMYREPVKAIVREIASNARDANRAAGRGDQPIKVSIKRSADTLAGSLLGDSSTISFQDQGLGMDPHKIANIYVRYGESDKTETNELTGGFGLGSKTPFAHADVFTVTTICDTPEGRKKYTYIISRDSSMKGKTSLVSTESTDEDTGTTVTIPLEEEDINQFEEACEHYFQYWDIPVQGYEYIHNEPLAVHDDFILYRPEDTGEKGVFLIMDGIHYPLQTGHKDIAPYIDELIKSIRVNFHMGLVFNTGDLEPLPSREDVRYTNEVVATIIDRLKNLDLNTIFSHLFKNVTLQNSLTYNVESLYRFSSYIQDPRLKRLVTVVYPIYGRFRNIPGLYLREIPYYRKTPIDKEVDLKMLLKHLAIYSAADLYVYSDDTHKVKYKNNRRKIIKSYTNQMRLEPRGITENLAEVYPAILECFTTVTPDYEVEYTPPTRIRSNNQTLGVSYRVLHYARQTILYTPAEFALTPSMTEENLYIIPVDSIKDIEPKEHLSLAERLLIEDKDYRILFVNRRNLKRFTYPLWQDFVQEKTTQLKLQQMQRKINYHSISKAVYDQLCPVTATIYRTNLPSYITRTKIFKAHLGKKCGSSHVYYRHSYVDHQNYTQVCRKINQVQKEISPALNRVLGYYDVKRGLTPEMVQELKKLKKYK